MRRCFQNFFNFFLNENCIESTVVAADFYVIYFADFLCAGDTIKIVFAANALFITVSEDTDL